MNCKITKHPHKQIENCTPKALRASYFPTDHEQKGQMGRQIFNLRDEYTTKEKLNFSSTYFDNKFPIDIMRKHQSKIQLRNAEKLKHFEQLKASNIDDLNSKIQRMISKLSDEISPASSIITKGSKARMKTDYSDLSTTHVTDSGANDSQAIFDNFFGRDKREMMESEVIKHSQIFQERKPIQNGIMSKADAIRKKYKVAPDAAKGKQSKHEKSMSALDGSSTFEAPYPFHRDAELIRFRQKLKINNEKERKELSRQLNFPLNSSIQRLPAKPQGKQKRNIDEEMKQYEKRLNKYDSKKLLCLANEGQFERVPLGDRTNNNSYLKYSPYTCKSKQPVSHCKLKIKREDLFEPNVEDFQQLQQPLTADFRQLSDKNQLKVLLKNLQGQISLDEQFRNCKKWFERVSDPSKWEELTAHVQLSNLDLDQTSIHEIFSLKEEEENPFYTPRQNQYDYQRLVELFIRCEEHWFENIVKKYNEQRLMACGFRESKLDIAGKGYLAIEDLVRFLNLQMDLQVRNRDLLMIFQRVRSEQELRFSELLEVICQ